MSKNLNVKFNSKSSNGTQVWEATVSIPGTKPTKLVQRATGNSQFSTRAAALTSARSLAKGLGFGGVAEPTVAKKAAKKSVKAKTQTPSTQS